MDNAPDYGSGDSRFDSWQARSLKFHSFLATNFWECQTVTYQFKI